MRKLMILFVLVSILLGTGCEFWIFSPGEDDPGTQYPDDPGNDSPVQLVSFPDSNLEAAVRTVLTKPQGDITREELATLEVLDAAGCDIFDLSGLEHCTSLLTLDLSDNFLTELSPIAGLDTLITLDLSLNLIV